jgi:SMC interacting uncharacterized protein involved in chromosome segregation
VSELHARPMTEKQALERELDELRALLESRRSELDAAPLEAQERRERILWQLRRAEKRMAEIETRLQGASG